MKYMGSKARIARDLWDVMSPIASRRARYIEPFAGGFNMMAVADHPVRLAFDVNEYVIAMFSALLQGWEPPAFVTKAEYDAAKQLNGPPELVGFIGICCSYSGKWFGGYAGITQTKGGERNYIDEARRNLMKQVPRLQGVQVAALDYREIEIPPNSFPE